MGSDSVHGVDRRRLLGWGGLAAAGFAAGAPLVGAELAHATPASTGPDALATSGPSGHGRIPPDTRPGGAYDRFVAKLAAQDKFSGVVLLSYRGRTVLSRSYGMADKEKGIRNHEGVAFNLSSASLPFLSVAILQLVQQGKVSLSDTVGTHLEGLATDIAEQVTIHHLLTGTSGMDAPMPDWQRVYHSREEVHESGEQWARRATLVGVPGSGSNGHLPGGGVGLAMAAQIVEAVSGMTFWDYVHEHVFGRAGMTGSAFYTREQWLTDEHIAHPYMRQADDSRVDAVRNLDRGSVSPPIRGRNPARSFIGYASADGFATAPDLVRFAHALRDGTLLDRPYADLFAGAKLPGPGPTSFEAYTMPISIIGGQWVIGRGGGTGGGGANWTIYPDTGWVGVVLSNYDDMPLLEICLQEVEAVTGQRLDPPGGG
ncbi:CubicO group peptidase, beta-lactamase class C family [Micromonospora phaseoli]|uniref:CubicO group peptidase, beta-lactamase class C family n=1 Tax=Micromonospora phaseoli TaxID=1144548 RepID=A0A1H6RC06_9ACTN|nr:serine hydrolase domain-containing protein [Micromonospora phaseoli]PZW03356.1 CubicO group peptidase (beta-lactamase class C family) [Micromonospora phaseoli]SEI52016.1 CubicO group peptidase, beta-lactamase class C family [Micromonospora phaseoli]